MFNERISDADAAQEETIQVAKQRSVAPNQASAGNAGGVVGSSMNLIVAPPTITDTDEIGVDENGREFFPFQLGVDWVGRPGAQLQPVGVLYDFGY